MYTVVNGNCLRCAGHLGHFTVRCEILAIRPVRGLGWVAGGFALARSNRYRCMLCDRTLKGMYVRKTVWRVFVVLAAYAWLRMQIFAFCSPTAAASGCLGTWAKPKCRAQVATHQGTFWRSWQRSGRPHGVCAKAHTPSPILVASDGRSCLHTGSATPVICRLPLVSLRQDLAPREQG